MRCAKLLLKIPGNWISEVSVKCNASIKVLKCVPSRDNTGRSLLKIESASEMNDEELMEQIRGISPTCQVNLSSAGPGKHIAAVTNTACAICGVLNEADCFLDSAVSQQDGRVVWKVIAPRSENISNLVNRLKGLGCEVEVIGLHDEDEACLLTYHQEKMLRIAYDLGYYDIPRGCNLDELASRAGISKSTLDIILRRAEKKLIAHHIGRP